VILELSDEALEFGRTALRALEAAGGDELAERAEQDPETRGSLVDAVLGDLGAWELDVRHSIDELEAAAALCRSAGWWALAYPVAERLARPMDLDVEVDGLVVVAHATPAAPVYGIDARWAAVTLDGRRHVATPRPLTTSVRKAAYVTGLDLEPAAGDGFLDLALGLVLPCWTLLGMLDRAMALTRAHVLGREQFGQPIGRFQGVQFQLTDAEVERVGLEELAKYALWSVEIGSDDAVVDALALRAAAIEAADLVLRVAHQLHGAIGFCDETFLSWLSRASVPLRRLPLNLAGTRAELARQLGRRGLTGIFSDEFA
jgi:hypothetical protein